MSSKKRGHSPSPSYLRTSPSPDEHENKSGLDRDSCYILKKDYVNLRGHLIFGFAIDPTDVIEKNTLLGNFNSYYEAEDFEKFRFTRYNVVDEKGVKKNVSIDILIPKVQNSLADWKSYFQKINCNKEGEYTAFMAMNRLGQRLPPELREIISKVQSVRYYQKKRGGTRRKKAKKSKTRRHRRH